MKQWLYVATANSWRFLGALGGYDSKEEEKIYGVKAGQNSTGKNRSVTWLV